MRTVILSEAQINRLFLLRESQESKSISQAKKLVMQRLGYDEAEADKFIRVKLRQDLPSLRTPEGGKFILGVTRMFLDGQLTDASIILQLNKTLKYVASEAHINEYDKNLNGISAIDLIQRFSLNIQNDIANDKEEINQMQFNDASDYQIIPINTFEEAKQYSRYTTWCVTHYKNMFKNYTNNGLNQFYFCLKDGFENVPQEVGENAPLDEFGLSMIAVSVDGEGVLNTCTCRWNHENGGNDNIMGTKEISQIIGRNFYQTFKPNNKWNEILEEKLQRLANGEHIRDVFDNRGSSNIAGLIPVEIEENWNVLNTKTNTFILKKWLKLYGYENNIYLNFNDGWAEIAFYTGSGIRCNFLSLSGELMFPNEDFQGYPNTMNRFYDGYAQIVYNGQYNLVDTNGHLVSPTWFKYCAERFVDNYLQVRHLETNKCNYIDKQGKPLSPDIWFDWCGEFYHGRGDCEINGHYFQINQEGTFLTKYGEVIDKETIMKFRDAEHTSKFL